MTLKENDATDCTLTLTPLAKGCLKNGQIKNGHNLNNIKKADLMLRNIDIDEYIAVGIHDAQPTTSKKVDKLRTTNREKNNITNKIAMSNEDIR